MLGGNYTNFGLVGWLGVVTSPSFKCLFGLKSLSLQYVGDSREGENKD